MATSVAVHVVTANEQKNLILFALQNSLINMVGTVCSSIQWFKGQLTKSILYK